MKTFLIYLLSVLITAQEDITNSEDENKRVITEGEKAEFGSFPEHQSSLGLTVSY